MNERSGTWSWRRNKQWSEKKTETVNNECSALFVYLCERRVHIFLKNVLDLKHRGWPHKIFTLDPVSVGYPIASFVIMYLSVLIVNKMMLSIHPITNGFSIPWYVSVSLCKSTLILWSTSAEDATDDPVLLMKKYATGQNGCCSCYLSHLHHQ